MEYKGVHVESYGYRSPYPVPDFREFLDLAARVDALEKRLAEDEPEATPKPASEYITKKRAKEIVFFSWPDDHRREWLTCRGRIDAEPGADVVPRVSGKLVFPDFDPAKHVDPTLPEGCIAINDVVYRFLSGVAVVSTVETIKRAKRQGVEAVAKWFEHGGEARETISAGIRANIESILKEAGDES